eukprot:1575359-Prymnesium_polylepis.1
MSAYLLASPASSPEVGAAHVGSAGKTRFESVATSAAPMGRFDAAVKATVGWLTAPPWIAGGVTIPWQSTESIAAACDARSGKTAAKTTTVRQLGGDT